MSCRCGRDWGRRRRTGGIGCHRRGDCGRRNRVRRLLLLPQEVFIAFRTEAVRVGRAEKATACAAKNGPRLQLVAFTFHLHCNTQIFNPRYLRKLRLNTFIQEMDLGLNKHVTISLSLLPIVGFMWSNHTE